jgi:predicted SprT family Zn-dependent metalloprotease
VIDKHKEILYNYIVLYKNMNIHNPTALTYTSLSMAYDFFNMELFSGALPPCLITVQRKKGSFGYFSGERFQNTANQEEITDEIALNPAHFAARTREEVFSTLAHEMVHLWQHHFGTPPTKSYHDKEWARKMREIGLIPTATGERGGKETGQKMSHLIDEVGNFKRACQSLLASHPAILYSDRAHEEDPIRKKKLASKTKYTCPSCGLNAWAKPEAPLVCGECHLPMQSEGGEQS